MKDFSPPSLEAMSERFDLAEEGAGMESMLLMGRAKESVSLTTNRPTMQVLDVLEGRIEAYCIWANPFCVKYIGVRSFHTPFQPEY